MSGSDLKLPVKAEPFDHQKKAFEFVLWLFGMMDGTVRSTGAALLMQMGTGKSFVSVAVAGWMFLQKNQAAPCRLPAFHYRRLAG